eukprot:COSAG06_NODE_913_length_11579_cov_25.672387_9_plen_144_part_00
MRAGERVDCNNEFSEFTPESDRLVAFIRVEIAPPPRSWPEWDRDILTKTTKYGWVYVKRAKATNFAPPEDARRLSFEKARGRTAMPGRMPLPVEDPGEPDRPKGSRGVEEGTLGPGSHLNREGKKMVLLVYKAFRMVARRPRR